MRDRETKKFRKSGNIKLDEDTKKSTEGDLDDLGEDLERQQVETNERRLTEIKTEVRDNRVCVFYVSLACPQLCQWKYEKLCAAQGSVFKFDTSGLPI